MTTFEQSLRAELDCEVRFDALTRALYSTDASVYQIHPMGAVIPKTRADIEKTFTICRRHKVPVTMRGGGTSQGGQTIGKGLQMDISKHYNRVLEVNAEERWARVEPGIVLDELNAQLAPLKLRFAPDISTASRATLGGMMGNNSCGARSVLYGKTIDHVLEQTVLLSDGSVAHFREVPRDAMPQGDSVEANLYRAVTRLSSDLAPEIDKRYPKILRRVMGYNLDEFVDQSKPVNLAKLMVGSEGTLGIVLEAKVRLVPLPKAKAVMVVGFEHLLEALSAAPLILRHDPSAVEVMDKSILDFTRQNANLDSIRKQFITGDPGATLCVEMYGEKAEDLPPRLEALEADLRANKFGYFYRHETDPTQQPRVWNLRESALGLSTAMKDDAKSISFVEDTAVAPEKLSEFIGKFLVILKEHGVTAGIYAHASVGCLHVRPGVNLKTEDGVAKFESIANKVADLVLEYGGALSGEHGDGLVRSPFIRKMFGDAIYEAFREIKRVADPENLLNPGKIVDPPSLTSNLRFGAGYQTPKILNTFFDFADYGGLGGAVEMCSGVGACRKKLSGTMCPSYMATRDEAHSTRGRANVLRLAMNGKLGEEGPGEKEVREALDLCLECRACKAECPVGVDMAAFKSEYLAGYYERHGTPLKAKLFGHIGELAKWGSAFAPLSNLGASALNQAVLGVDPRRKLPEFKRQTLEKQASRDNGADVVLFNDTFLNHYHPEVGLDAMEVLRRAGKRVDLIRPGCCGRPMISQGLLPAARANASKVTAALSPLAQAGKKILFCEPSCLSAFKEDIPSLLRGDERKQAEGVAKACELWDAYAATLDLPLKAGPKRVLLHGHCHQKSMGMLGATTKLLSKIPGASVVDLDAGCCGMAGSFGYSKEHYEVSATIANRKLLPAVKAMQEGDVLAAPGTSCRHQVEDLAAAKALHPATLLRSLLA